MKHRGTVRLETKRLILRRFREEDAGPMFRNWACDAEVTRFLTWQPHVSAEATGKLLAGWIADYENENYYNWAIVLKDNGDEPIGNISAVGLNDDISMVHIGYCIGKAWWHHGIMSEALKAVMDFFFDQVEANRIESLHDTQNPRSGMVMKRCGMKYEGTKRGAARNNQGICDVCCYALLKDERGV